MHKLDLVIETFSVTRDGQNFTSLGEITSRKFQTSADIKRTNLPAPVKAIYYLENTTVIVDLETISNLVIHRGISKESGTFIVSGTEKIQNQRGQLHLTIPDVTDAAILLTDGDKTATLVTHRVSSK